MSKQPGLLRIFRIGVLMVVAGHYLQVGLPITASGNVKFHACVGNQLAKFCEIIREKFQTAMRQVDVNHPAGTNRHCPEVLRTGEDGLIVQELLLPINRIVFIVRTGEELCNRIWNQSNCYR
jgi:hypothetical protein